MVAGVDGWLVVRTDASGAERLTAYSRARSSCAAWSPQDCTLDPKKRKKAQTPDRLSRRETSFFMRPVSYCCMATFFLWS